MAKFQIIVKPCSSQEKIIETAPSELTVYLHAQPHDGAANTTLVKLLSKHFKVPKTSITVTHGIKSRIKTVVFEEK